MVYVDTNGVAVLASSGLNLRVDQGENCLERYQGRFLGVDAQTSIDAVHYLSAGAVCFSRAVNDTPKIAALLLLTQGGASGWASALVLAGMVLGGMQQSST